MQNAPRCRRWPHSALGAVVFLVLHLVAESAWGAITLSVGAPVANSVQGKSLTVSVVVTSTYAVQTVSAAVGSVSQNLTAPSTPGAPWTGTLAIGPLTYGPQTLTITATDLLANTSSTTVAFVHHNQPVIDVSSPINWQVARPTVALAATCTDDTGCLNFRAQVDADVLATGSGSISSVAVDLSKYDGRQVGVMFTANDSFDGGATKGWVTTVTALVYIDTSAKLVEAATVPGFILDFDATRVLYRKDDGSVVIKDRSALSEMTIGNVSQGSGALPLEGHLTSTGAMWFSTGTTPACVGNTYLAFSWTPGAQATQVGAACAFPFIVTGDWAMSYTATGFTLLNLTTNQTTQHPFPQPTNEAGTIMGGRGEGVATPSGDIFGFVQEPDLVTLSIYRDQGGVLTRLGTSISKQGGSLWPITDGTSIVYNAFNFDGNYSLSLFSNGADTFLGQPQSVQFQREAYQIVNGWVAFSQRSAAVAQVWLRSPQGTSRQVSIYNTDSTIDALSGAGEVMFLNADQRYLGTQSSPPELVSSALGNAVARCDGWYVKMGGTVFRVAAASDAGLACPPIDAGVGADAAVDAGVVDVGAVDAVREDAAIADGSGVSNDGDGGDEPRLVDASTDTDVAAVRDAGSPMKDSNTAETGSQEASPEVGESGCGCRINGEPAGERLGWLQGLAALIAAVVLRSRRTTKRATS
jgi:hypothetical protein